MKKKLFLGLLAAAAVSFTACQKDEVISEVPQDQAIGFGTYVGRDAQTKASVIDETALGTQGFGVFAYYTGTADYPVSNTTIAPAFMNNVKVWYDTSLEPDAWNYENLKYWPGTTDKISFFAYAPYQGTGITNLPTTGTKSDPTITFAVQDEVENQIDLLYAEPVKDEYYNKNSNGGTVSFNFKHALSRIGFKVKTSGTHYRVNIEKITISGNFYNGGVFNLNSKVFTTKTPDTPTNKEYEFNFTTANEISTTDGSIITATEQYAMIIPTDLSTNGVNVTVNYTYEYQATTGIWSTPEDMEQTGTAGVNFEQGKAYTLVLTLDPLIPIKFDVTAVTGWDESEAGYAPGVGVTNN